MNDPYPTAVYGRPSARLEPVAVQTLAEPQVHKFEFTGSANEYFRIWIVNALLTIVTLGVYAAWAKVRTRQYFYSNTRLDGHAFEYLGNPISILKGNLVLAALLGGYYVINQVAPLWSLALLAVGGLAFPWLLWQSVRFLASNTAYRNIRFRFHGSLGGAYTHYLLWPMAMIVGPLIPRGLFNQRSYLYGNVAYGTSKNEFRGELATFGSIYWKAVGLGMVVYLLTVIAGAALLPSMTALGGLGSRQAPSQMGVLMLAVPVYLAILGAGMVIQQFMQVNLFNHSLSSCAVPGKLRFHSDLHVMDLVKIRVVNFLAIACSLGLLSPWAKVRYVEYVLSKVTVVSDGELGDFAAAETDRQNALGDAATDYLNFDFGL